MYWLLTCTSCERNVKHCDVIVSKHCGSIECMFNAKSLISRNTSMTWSNIIYCFQLIVTTISRTVSYQALVYYNTCTTDFHGCVVSWFSLNILIQPIVMTPNLYVAALVQYHDIDLCYTSSKYYATKQ